MIHDLQTVLETDPLRTVYSVQLALMAPLCIHLVAVIQSRRPRDESTPFGGMQRVKIVCNNAVDYSIRPRNPNLLEGGPFIELHEKHPLLDAPHLRFIPGGDGK